MILPWSVIDSLVCGETSVTEKVLFCLKACLERREDIEAEQTYSKLSPYPSSVSIEGDENSLDMMDTYLEIDQISDELASSHTNSESAEKGYYTEMIHQMRNDMEDINIKSQYLIEDIANFFNQHRISAYPKIG